MGIGDKYIIDSHSPLHPGDLRCIEGVGEQVGSNSGARTIEVPMEICNGAGGGLYEWIAENL